MDKYVKIDKLGEGSYGIVYKAQHKETGQHFALKRIRLENEEEGIPCTAIREIALLKQLNHPNIVYLHDVLHTEKKLTLIFEYLNTDLKKFIDSMNGEMDSLLVKRLLYQIFRGIDYCHKKRILHRDLKPQNILLDQNGILKLADFGLARSFGIPIRNYSNEVVTLWYRSPDILLGCKQYDSSIDIWSIGCIFAEMASGRPIFPGGNISEELTRIFKILGTPTDSENSWPGLSKLPDYQLVKDMESTYSPIPLHKLVPRLDDDGLDLLSKCIQYVPSKRISAANALLHPYFKDLKHSNIYR